MIKFYDLETKIGKGTVKTKGLPKNQISKIINDQIGYYGLTLDKNYRKIINIIIQKDDFITTAKKQKRVKTLTINVEWKKSYTWGNNPYAMVELEFFDGTFERVKGFTVSGCGYDKESSVIGNICNDFLLYKLYELQGCTKKLENKPYGIYTDFKNNSVHFEGGVGTNCYYSIVEFLGGKMERVASGSNFDAYTITFKK